MAQQQATAHKAAVAAAARAAAQALARAQAAARVKASLARAAAATAAAQKQAAAEQMPAFAPGCSGSLLKLGACPSERGAAGTTAAQVKQAMLGAFFVIGSALTGGLLDAAAPEEVAAVVSDGATDDITAQAAADEAGAGGGGNDDPGTEDNPSCSAATPGGESFTAATLVLLASGKAVPISSLKPGDKVLASDTNTGKNQPEIVTAVLLHHDTDLYNLTVKTSHGTNVIHTTAKRLFWDPSLNYGWIPAKSLKPGMHLKAPGGQTAVVVGGSVPAVHDGWMWDLTVPGNNDHDSMWLQVPRQFSCTTIAAGMAVRSTRRAPRGLAIFLESRLKARRLVTLHRSGITRCSAMTIF